MATSTTGFPNEAGTGGTSGVTLIVQTAAFTVTETMVSGNRIVEIDSASNVAITIPSGLVNTQPVTFVQTGAGTFTVLADTGVTLVALEDKVTSQGAGAFATMYQSSSDKYILGGGLA